MATIKQLHQLIRFGISGVIGGTSKNLLPLILVNAESIRCKRVPSRNGDFRGALWFLADAGIVALCTQSVGVRPIPAQTVAFSVAVTITWLINRHWTFAENASEIWLH